MNSRMLLIAALAVSIAAALVPFRLDLPRHVSNGLDRPPAGPWRLREHSIARSFNGPPWVREATRSETLDVNVKVRSARARQSGPARILTNSAGFHARNLTVAQDGSDLVVRLRRPGSDANGEPAFVVPDVFRTGRWRDITVAIRPRRVQIHVDGTLRVARSLPADALAGWDPTFGIALGNEVSGQRPWAGDIAVAEVATASGRDDLLAPGRLEIPDAWWHVPARLGAFTRVELPTDAGIALLHLVAFLPVGYLLTRKGPERDVRSLIMRVGGLSLLIELMKVGIAGRHPSLLNLVAQVVGGLGGAVMFTGWPPPRDRR